MKRELLVKKFGKILKAYIINYYYTTPNKRGRKLKAPVSYYVSSILFVITQGVSWRALDELPIKGPVKSSAIRKMFNKWAKKKIFSKAYCEFLSKYIDEYGETLKELFIDSTIIPNFCGTKDMTNYCKKIPNKRSTKMTIICNEEKIPLCNVVGKSNTHDVKYMEPAINNLPIEIKNKGNYNKPIVISADKGYVTSKKNNLKFRKKGITINFCKRDNMKHKKYTKKNKELLKKRIKIENTFARLKKTFKRISEIKDKSIEVFNTWVMIASTMLIYEQLN